MVGCRQSWWHPPPRLTLTIILEGHCDYLHVTGVRWEQTPHSSTFRLGPGGDMHLPGLSQRLSQGTVTSSDRTKQLPLPAECPPCRRPPPHHPTEPYDRASGPGRQPTGRTRKRGRETRPRPRASAPTAPRGALKASPPRPLAGGPPEEGHCELWPLESLSAHTPGGNRRPQAGSRVQTGCEHPKLGWWGSQVTPTPLPGGSEFD